MCAPKIACQHNAHVQVEAQAPHEHEIFPELLDVQRLGVVASQAVRAYGRADEAARGALVHVGGVEEELEAFTAVFAGGCNLLGLGLRRRYFHRGSSNTLTPNR
ncbi:hypothetical protein CVT25_004049 [Psilocybe cyanescens]|uniref:Uncharacterized protein n=1 Tax=Psilocybe cyanescens TaxID=93625 RepID=A0A409WXM7_PSICY|nr:hypothetical protein CVT25_004049 [Psilocybe cyanescens]